MSAVFCLGYARKVSRAGWVSEPYRYSNLSSRRISADSNVTYPACRINVEFAFEMRSPSTSADTVATIAVETETRPLVSSVSCSAGRSFLSFQPTNAPAKITVKTISPTKIGLFMCAPLPSSLTYPGDGTEGSDNVSMKAPLMLAPFPEAAKAKPPGRWRCPLDLVAAAEVCVLECNSRWWKGESS